MNWNPQQRDPFARQTLERAELPAKPGGCSWCGNTNRRGNLFAYRTASDGGRNASHAGAFCCRACFNAYQGG